MTQLPGPVRRGRKTLLRLSLAASMLAIVGLAPATAQAATCKTFTGDATGRLDVTSALNSFIAHHNGLQLLCLKLHGIYRVDGIITLNHLTGLRFDGRNSQILPKTTASASSNRRQIYIYGGRNNIIRNLIVRGGNPNFAHWDPSRQHQPGIWIDGGTNNKLERISIRDTYGDGIYIGFRDGAIAPPSGLVLSHVNVGRSGRSGIAIVAGNHIVISSSTVFDSSLHSIDLEPDYAAGNIHNVSVVSTSMSRFGRSGADTGYAFAANGKAGSMSYISVTNSRADRFQTTIQAPSGQTHRYITFRGNRSTLSAKAYFSRIVGLSYSSNLHITAYRSSVR